ncbi:MAG: lipopolysaccharide kinase InaA family protein [Candidatus Hydrogenedentota bacterium]
MHVFTAVLNNTVSERCGNALVHHRENIDCQRILEIISNEGDILKVSPKYITRRVNGYVVKASSGSALHGLLNGMMRRNRYRRGWMAGLYLEQEGVKVPRAHALVEMRRYGFTEASYLIMDYLDGAYNVERFAADMVQEAASDQLPNFFRALAQSINALREAGVYHRDLSGKNILTREGKEFFFIDLESIFPVKRYTRRMHFKNHVQLYDSFCDFVGDDMLEVFLSELLPENEDYARWSKIVRHGQAARRARQIATWRKQGKSL